MTAEKLKLYLQAKAAYYNDAPIMTDAQFDELEAEIRAENPDAPELKSVGAPVPAATNKSRVKHRIPMGSQEKVNTAEEFKRWESLRANAGDDARFHISLKADGSSLALYYEEGRLAQAVTRGDGTEGENITHQAPLFQGVPSRLPLPLTIGIRCEAVVTTEDWGKADHAKETNPRNIASGILGRLDTTKSRFITALAFDIEHTGKPRWDRLEAAETESDKTGLLKALGFSTVPHVGGVTLAQTAEFYEKTGKDRQSGNLPYWIDGIVVRYESLETQKSLGITDNRPKGQVAWKFPAEGAETTLKAVQWQVGQSGAVTPVGILEPVQIGGTTVTKASLANAGNITALKAFLGAPVTAVKAGDIIPAIISVNGAFDPAKGHLLIQIPQHCPECGAGLSRKSNVDGSDSAVLFCVNPDCPAQTAGKIRRFCKSRDILGLGESVIAGLLGSSAIQDVSDLPNLKPETIENILINPEKAIRLGRKRAEAICAEIREKTREMSLPEFLGAFGTRGLGVRRATLMIQANPELENLGRWFDGSLADPEFSAKAGVPQLGNIIAEDLQKHEATIRKMLAHTKITRPENPGKTQAGMTVCITGSLPSGKKKKDYAGALEAKGHRLVDDLTKDVNVLVLADPSGPESSKTKKAKKLGIELHGETWLQALCG